MNHVEPYAKWGAAAVASLWAGMPDLTRLLILLMALDIAFGLAVAVKNRNLSPSVSWAGLTKKLGSLGMVVVAALLNPYNPIQGINLVSAASAFYAVTEILSIARNASSLGVASFPGLDNVLKYFQGVSGQGTNETTDLPKDAKRTT